MTSHVSGAPDRTAPQPPRPANIRSTSLDVQVESCRDAAKRLNVGVVTELIKAPSTSGDENRGRSRPKFQELLELIRAGEVDCVIAYTIDRL